MVFSFHAALIATACLAASAAYDLNAGGNTAGIADYDCALADDPMACASVDEGLSLLQTRAAKRIEERSVAFRNDVMQAGHGLDDSNVGPLQPRAKHAVPSCARLHSESGVSFTTRITVGTPPQQFDVVVDTGSSNVLVPWCKCINRSPGVPCYSPQKSMTFLLPLLPLEVKEGFGSGDIDSTVVSDIVAVGDTVAFMNKSLFVMLLTKLSFHSPFDGLLGLSRPSLQFDSFPSFMQEAGLHRFSVCMKTNSGALRLGGSPGWDASNQMTNIGQDHWALGMFGVSAGDSTADSAPIYCSKDSMEAGMESPCMAIMDTGTTDITGPRKGVHALFSAICEQWPRCKKSAKTSKRSKREEFLHLLHHCSDWISKGHTIDELPALHFDVEGGNKKKQRLTLTAEDYIGAVVSKSGEELTCVPSISVGDLPTVTNGPAWILGLPLFYRYTVDFSLRKEGSMSFTEGSCQECPKGDRSDEELDALQVGQLHEVAKHKAKFPRLRKQQPRSKQWRF